MSSAQIYWRSVPVALRSLRRNKLQTGLTVVGMAIGVAAVLTMMAVGTGAERAIQDQVRAAGMNVIVVRAGNYRMQQQWTSDGETEEQRGSLDVPSVPPEAQRGRAGVPQLRMAAYQLPLAMQSEPAASGSNPVVQREEQDPENAAGLGASQRLSLQDAEAVAGLAGVQFVSAGMADNVRAEAGAAVWFTRLRGEGVAMIEIRRSWSLRHGRYFSRREFERGESVAVLGSVAAQHLFGAENPVGRMVLLKGRTYRVIGVIASSSWMVPARLGDGQFDAVYVPTTSAQSLLQREYLDTLTVSTASTGEVTRVSQAITQLLRQRHGLNAQRLPDDFSVSCEAHQSLVRGGMRTDVARAVVGNVSSLDKVTLDELGKTLDQASRTMTALLASVATVSLLVGGIGIMNIMLLSVTERTREIGVRRAVGATSQEVMSQFLAEAVLLSVVGGLVGMALGVAAAVGISRMAQWSTHLSGAAMLLSFGFAAGIGVVFGYYPARAASQVSPMTSLRYE